MPKFEGCQEGKKTPDLKEVKCPKCGAIMEVFVKDTRVIETAKCSKCGYEIKEGASV